MAFDKKFILSELKKCQDPIYFIKNHVYIQSGGRKALFELYPFQEECLNSFVSNRFNIVLKSRQLGLSTLMAAYIAWYMLFHQDKVVLVISLTEQDSKEFVRKIKYAFDFISPWVMEALGAKIIFNNVHTVELNTRSRVKALAPTEDAGRGYTPSLFIIDEAAQIDHLEKIWTESAFPALNTGGGSAIINSTAYGMSNFFYDMWSKTETNESDFNAIKLDWQVHPDRDEKWYEDTIKQIGKVKFSQEYGCNFQQSGETVIDPDDIQFLRKNIVNPEQKSETDRALWTWEKPNKDHKYLITSDVSSGTGKDYSTAVVFDLNTLQIVCEFKAKVKPDSLADLLMIIGYRYNTAIICVENMHTGFAVLRRIVECSYKNIYHYNKSTEEHCCGYFDDSLPNLDLGFNTNVKTRPIAIERLEHYIRNRLIIPTSERLVEEAESFVYGSRGKPEAKNGKNDDLVMTYAIGCYLLQHFAIGSSRKMLLSDAVTNYYQNQRLTSNKKFDYFGLPDEQKKSQIVNPYQIETPTGVENISWVLGPRKPRDDKNLQKSIFIK